jgi:hypothetical protein
MKKIGMLHLGIVLAIILSLITLIMFWAPEARGADRRSNPYRSKEVYERRQRIQQSGNINNFYQKPVRVEWAFINGRARMVIFFNRR